MKNKKLLVCDVEGTIFKAEYKIPGTDFASTMWQPIAQALGEDAIREERESHIKWDRSKQLCADGRNHYKNYLEWVKDTAQMHQRHKLQRDVFETLIASAIYNDGVIDFFKEIQITQNYIPVLISGGFQELIKRAQIELGIEHGFGACEYIWGEDNLIKAWNLQPSDFEDKYAFLSLLFRNYNLKDTKDWIFIGDGKNDADIASRAPISFAINPHVELASVSTYTVDNFADIMKILSSDEAPPYISKRRGLSNLQSITVGQRMLNSGEEKEGSIRQIRSANKQLKYYFQAQINDLKPRCTPTQIFNKVVICILNFSKKYADSSEMESEINNMCLNHDIQSFRLYGVSRIEASYYCDKDQKLWAQHIASPDVGTYFRHPIVGCSFDMDISISCIGDSVNLCVRVYSKLPEGHFTGKEEFELESYRPHFLDDLSKDFYFKNYKRIAAEPQNVNSISIRDFIDRKDRSIPIILIKNENVTPDYKLDTMSIAKALFTYAIIYTLKEKDYNALLTNYGIHVQKEKYSDNFDAYAAIFYPQEWEVKDVTWYLNDILDCPDRIDYSVNRQERILHSGAQAFEKLLIDTVIDKHKMSVMKTSIITSNFYKDLHAKEQKKALSDASRMSVENRVEEITRLVQEKLDNSRLDLIQIEKKVALALAGTNKSDSVTKNQFTGVMQALIDGELVFSLMRTALGQDVQLPNISGSILQPFSNATEVFLKANLLLAIPKSEQHSFVVKYGKSMVGELIEFLKTNEAIAIKKTRSKQDIIGDLFIFSTQRNIENAHNCTLLSIEDAQMRIKDRYNLIKLIYETLDVIG